MKSNATLLMFLFVIPQDVLVNAYLKNTDKKLSQNEDSEKPRDRSSNEIVDAEIKQKLADEHHYYLPMQTTFGSQPLKPSTYGGAITSPPHLSISPSSAEAIYGQSSRANEDRDKYFNDDHITPYLSQCITETPSKDEQPKSEIPFLSKDLISESVVLAGHIEIPSKTSNEIPALQISNTAEFSLVQGTEIYMPSITDM
ncbi:hypothetical protein JTE90_012499 [Oedothorax gibbosus]|uniref:Uncharacterized protein n=1 Tax=Oedothorax gibbosus TaxID=931172 RepID=A0AAV6U4I0_9ARAC|nr:hypothetical protein JTE90_012499 [Oedothorax gibbosus]